MAGIHWGEEVEVDLSRRSRWDSMVIGGGGVGVVIVSWVVVEWLVGVDEMLGGVLPPVTVERFVREDGKLIRLGRMEFFFRSSHSLMRGELRSKTSSDTVFSNCCR